MAKIRCIACGGSDLRYTDEGYFQCADCGAKYAPSQIQKLMKEDEPAAAKAADSAPLDEVHALCRQGKYVQASAACEALSRSYPEDAGVWNAWADVLFSWMKEKRRPLVSGYCFVNVSAVFEAAAQADPTIKERKERMYHAMAEAILSGKASLFNAFASKLHDTSSRYCRSFPLHASAYEDWKEALLSASDEMRRVIQIGEAIAHRMQEMDMQYDDRPDARCFSMITPQKGCGIYRPVFALGDCIIGTDAEEDEEVTRYYMICPHRYILPTEDFIDDAVQELISQWENLDCCPYCFSRRIRRKFMKNERVCEDCGRTIEPIRF